MSRLNSKFWSDLILPAESTSLCGLQTSLLAAVIGFPDASTLVYALMHTVWIKSDTFFKRIIVISSQSAEQVAQDFNDFVRYFAPLGYNEATSRDQMPWSGLNAMEFVRHAISGVSPPPPSPPPTLLPID